MNPIVRVELSVDDLRHKVVHALAASHKEIEELVAAELEQYVNSGRLKLKLQQFIQKHMDEAVDTAVKHAVSSWSRESPTVKQAVEKAIHEALWKTEEG